MLKRRVLPSIALGLGLFAANPTHAQSLTGGFMVGKGHGSVAFTGTAERYHHVFLGTERIDEVPIFRRVRVSSLSVYANYGITDKIEAVVSLPYIQSRGYASAEVVADGGYTNTRSGLQDVSALLKFKTYSLPVGSNTLDLLGVVGVSTPASNYESGKGLEYIIAIGNQATKLTTLGIAHFKTPLGVFLTGQAGYSQRTNRVPNAFVGDAKIGYAGLKTYVEAWASVQRSSATGTDIVQTGFDGVFRATRVNFTRLGASVFRPLAKGVGLTAGASTYVAGRNLGQSTAVSLGVAYNY